MQYMEDYYSSQDREKAVLQKTKEMHFRNFIFWPIQIFFWVLRNLQIKVKLWMFEKVKEKCHPNIEVSDSKTPFR